jgi:hypothetical protein
MIEDKIFVRSNFYKKKKKEKTKWKVVIFYFSRYVCRRQRPLLGFGAEPRNFFFSCTKSIKFITAYKAPNKI